MHKPKICKSWFFESKDMLPEPENWKFFIFDNSINIYCHSSISQLIYLFWGQRRHTANDFIGRSIFGDNCLCNILTSLQRGKIRSKWKFLNAHIGTTNYIISRCLSRVFYDHACKRAFLGLSNCCNCGDISLRQWGWWISNITNGNFVYKNIGPKLPSCSADHYNNGPDKGTGLERRKDSNNPSGNFDSAIRRRLLLFLFFGFGGFILSIWAGGYLYDERPLLGVALVILGILFILGSLGLLVATQYPTTWGWPL